MLGKYLVLKVIVVLASQRFSSAFEANVRRIFLKIVEVQLPDIVDSIFTIFLRASAAIVFQISKCLGFRSPNRAKWS